MLKLSHLEKKNGNRHVWEMHEFDRARKCKEIPPFHTAQHECDMNGMQLNLRGEYENNLQ